MDEMKRKASEINLQELQGNWPVAEGEGVTHTTLSSLSEEEDVYSEVIIGPGRGTLAGLDGGFGFAAQRMMDGLGVSEEYIIDQRWKQWLTETTTAPNTVEPLESSSPESLEEFTRMRRLLDSVMTARLRGRPRDEAFGTLLSWLGERASRMRRG